MSEANRFKQFVMRLLGKKERLQPEKIRLTVKNGFLTRAYYPAHIAGNKAKLAMARQQVACYEIKLNGRPLIGGLG